MEPANSLTISSASGAQRAGRAKALRAAGWLTALVSLSLTACAIEVGPPPESDPPLVSEAAKAPPPPAQPTEPQAWSKDLDFESGPTKIDHKELAEGLVASNSEVDYSGQRLTYESALSGERPPTEAELALQRARERAVAAATVPPPQAVAAPVEAVSQQALPAAEGQEAAAPARRQSRLPPPPKFPPLPVKSSDAAEVAAAPQSQSEAEPAVVEEASVTTPEQNESQLPPEPKSAALPMAAEGAGAAAGATMPAPDDAATSAFLAEAWDAPLGTILVQVSAVQDKAKVIEEWQRLQGHHSQVLKPLRLVVDEAKLGDRGVFYRLQAGAFGSEAGAMAACDSLISQGQYCFVVVR